MYSGRQYIGSFHPEDPSEWEKGVYCEVDKNEKIDERPICTNGAYCFRKVYFINFLFISQFS